ncbi:hypothetical protein [Nonomuraea sp. NPDC049709]|uniref:hypothetical protein n=1 Tax=Nonomuraea sp. NPDC049709 TaxID=3154736 RepID=UPI0034402EE6
MPEHWWLRRRAATATSRLGLRTSLAAAFGDGDHGDFCWRTLEDQAVDLSTSWCFEQRHSPVTVSMAADLTAAWWSGML